MKLNSKFLGLTILIVLFGGIGFTTWMGWWQTETTKIPAVYTEGEAAGEYNPADIRGSYSFGDINRVFEIPLEDLAAAFNLPQDTEPADFQLKSLEEIYADQELEVGTASVRLFVAWYKGLPYTPDEETYLPPEAVALLMVKASLTSEQIAYLESHIAQPVENTEPTGALPAESTPASTTETQPAAIETESASQTEVTAEVPAEPTTELSAEPQTEATEHIQPDRTITGQTTFQQVLDWGVSQADIEQILGGSMPLPVTIIKDYATANGLTFSSLKTSLQDLVDQAAP